MEINIRIKSQNKVYTICGDLVALVLIIGYVNREKKQLEFRKNENIISLRFSLQKNIEKMSHIII